MRGRDEVSQSFTEVFNCSSIRQWLLFSKAICYWNFFEVTKGFDWRQMRRL